jgi:hypothetical protein
MVGYRFFLKNYFASGGSKASKASDIAVSCLEKIVMEYQSHHKEHAKDIARVVFPLLIIHPKVTCCLLLLYPAFFYFPAFILTSAAEWKCRPLE